MSQYIQNCKNYRKTTSQAKRYVHGKVLSEKNSYMSVNTALLLSNVIDVDHKNNCLFTNKGHLLGHFNVTQKSVRK